MARPRYPSDFIPTPVGRGRKAVGRPLTDAQRAMAAEHYDLARRMAGRAVLGRPRPGRTRDEDVSDLAWRSLRNAILSYGPNVRVPFRAWLQVNTRVRPSCLAIQPDPPAAPGPIDPAAVPDRRVGHEATIDAADAAEALLATIGGDLARMFRPIARDGLTKPQAAAAAGLTKQQFDDAARRARQILGGRPCSR